MKILGLCFLLALPTCFQKGPLEALPASFDETFRLACGESMVVGPDGLEVGFDRVMGDSRCPLGLYCYWQGYAQIGLWLREEGGEKIAIEIGTLHYVFENLAGSYHKVDTLCYRITLQQLDPYPAYFGDLAADADYEALLTVSRPVE